MTTDNNSNVIKFPRGRQPAPPDHQTMAAQALRHPHLFNDWEYRFLRSVRYYPSLSDRQGEIVEALYHRVFRRLDRQAARAAANTAVLLNSLLKHFDNNLALPTKSDLACYHNLDLSLIDDGARRSAVGHYLIIIRDPRRADYLPIVRALSKKDQTEALADLAYYNHYTLPRLMQEWMTPHRRRLLPWLRRNGLA